MKLFNLMKEVGFSWFWYGIIGRSWKGVSVDLPDGSLNEPLLIKHLKEAAKAGSNFIRIMWGWFEKYIDRLSTPFMWDDKEKSYRLLKPDGTLNLNPKYMPKLRRIGELVNKIVGVFVFGFLERCGVKDRDERHIYNPWMNNVEGFNGWWDTKTRFRIKEGPNKGKYLYAKDVVLMWVDAVCKTLEGLKWIPEIGNELALDDVEIQHIIITHLRKKKSHLFFQKYKIIKNGFMHDSPPWSKEPSKGFTVWKGWEWWRKTKAWGWHWVQKKLAWTWDPILIETWHWFQLWIKFGKMAKDNNHIIITPWTWFSIDGIGRVVMSAEKLIEKFSEILTQKGKGKWNTWINRPPFFEIMRTPQNPDHWMVPNEVCLAYTGKPLKKFLKWKGISFEDIEREYQEAIKPKTEPVKTNPIPEPTPAPTKKKINITWQGWAGIALVALVLIFIGAC